MTDDELDRLVVTTRRFSDSAVAALTTSGSERALLEEIMATPTLTTGYRTEEPPSRWQRSRNHVIALAVAAAAAAALVLVWMPGLGSDAGNDGTFAASDLAVAEANPRLLLDIPGWRIDDVSFVDASEGEMRFTDGRRELAVNWRPADLYQEFLDDRAADGVQQPDLTVLGRTAAVFQYAGSTDYTALLPPDGPNFLELRADVGSYEGYQELIGALHAVDVDTWLSALPDSVVQPRDRGDAVTEMLVGVPVPDGFDPAPLRDSSGMSDSYDIGADVSGAVACSWYSQWATATASGDAAAAQEAVDALLTARSWPVLIEMSADGAYPQAVWESADRVADGTAERADFGVGLGCDAPALSSYLD